jgi:hypothetical protein
MQRAGVSVSKFEGWAVSVQWSKVSKRALSAYAESSELQDLLGIGAKPLKSQAKSCVKGAHICAPSVSSPKV